METGKCGLAVRSEGKSCGEHMMHEKTQGQVVLRTHSMLVEGGGHLIQTVGSQERASQKSLKRGMDIN